MLEPIRKKRKRRSARPSIDLLLLRRERTNIEQKDTDTVSDAQTKAIFAVVEDDKNAKQRGPLGTVVLVDSMSHIGASRQPVMMHYLLFPSHALLYCFSGGQQTAYVVAFFAQGKLNVCVVLCPCSWVTMSRQTSLALRNFYAKREGEIRAHCGPKG